MNSNIQLPSNFRNIFYFALFIPLMVNAQGTYNHLEKIEYVCEKETVYGSLRSNQNFDFKSLERDIHKYSVKERTSQNPLWRDCPAFILPNDLFGFFWWFYKTPNNKTLGNMERLDNTITISNSLYNLFDLWRHSHKIVGNSCKDYFEFKKDQKKIQICSNGYVKVFSYWNTYWYPFHSSWWDFKVTRNIDIYAPEGNLIYSISFSDIDSRLKSEISKIESWSPPTVFTDNFSNINTISYYDPFGTPLVNVYFENDFHTVLNKKNPERDKTGALEFYGFHSKIKNIISADGDGNLIQRVDINSNSSNYSNKSDIQNIDNKISNCNRIKDYKIKEKLKIDEYNLEEFVECFLNDCKSYEIDISEQTISVIFEQLDENTIALAFGKDQNNLIDIKIDPENWLNSSIEKKFYILYHELGHDVFNLEHGQGGKMMFNFSDSEYNWFDFAYDSKKMFEYVKSKRFKNKD